MRKYLYVYWISLQNALAFGWAMIVVFRLSNLLALIAIAAVWLAADAQGVIGGYTKNELITYYIVGLAITPFVFWYSTGTIREEITEGGLGSIILPKPLNYYIYKFFQEAGWHTISSSSGLLAAGFAFLILGQYFLSPSLDPAIFLIIPAIFLGAVIMYNLSYCLGLLSFWFMEVSQFTNVLWLGIALIGGEMIPISFFPPLAKLVIQLLPFRYIFSFPLEIYTGHLAGQETWWGFMAAIFWAIITYLLSTLVWRRGIKIYQAYGS